MPTLSLVPWQSTLIPAGVIQLPVLYLTSQTALWSTDIRRILQLGKLRTRQTNAEYDDERSTGCLHVNEGYNSLHFSLKWTVTRLCTKPWALEAVFIAAPERPSRLDSGCTQACFTGLWLYSLCLSINQLLWGWQGSGMQKAGERLQRKSWTLGSELRGKATSLPLSHECVGVSLLQFHSDLSSSTAAGTRDEGLGVGGMMAFPALSSARTEWLFVNDDPFMHCKWPQVTLETLKSLKDATV